MNQTRDEWGYHSVDTCLIKGSPFMPTVLITDAALQVALSATGSHETPRLVAVNGRQILPKKWYRRNVVSSVRVGDTVTVAMPDGTEAVQVAQEIQSWFRWDDYEV